MSAFFDMHAHLSGRMVRVELDAERVQSLLVHCMHDLLAQGVLPQAGDHDGMQAEGLEMAGHVEGRAAQNCSIRKNIGQHFAEQYDRILMVRVWQGMGRENVWK